MTKAIEVKIPVDTKELAGALCSAVDGGISYWAKGVDRVGALTPIGREISAEFGWFAGYVLSGGTAAAIVIERGEDGEDIRHVVKRSGLISGLAKLAAANPYQFGLVLTGSGDAVTGDLLVQFAIFGKAVYT